MGSVAIQRSTIMVSLVLVFLALLAYVEGDITVNYQGGHYGHNIESKYQLPPIQDIQTTYGPIRITPFVQLPEVRTLYPVRIRLTTGHIDVPPGTFQLQKNENGWIFTHVTDFSTYPAVA